VSRRTRGVVACGLLTAGLAVGLLAGCAGGGNGAGESGEAVSIPSPAPDAGDRAACARILTALPDSLAGERRRPITPHDALGAAWGDPAMVLTCGVDRPADFDEFATCVEANGVDWFVPADQVEDDSLDVTFSTAGYRPIVQLDVPAEYRPEGGAAALAELAKPLRKRLETVQPCR
jgi:Protein of unknown function (DUF3515)